MIKTVFFCVALGASVMALAGCAQLRHTVVPTSDDLIIADQKPVGYPRTYIEPYPDFPNFCRNVVEDYVQHEGVDQRLWFK
ncbi:MAG: YgdI/YgdR family lipoprotein, partial [Tepidimonas taiwanensis]|nr:YgdI/YgdR family lipoprotein [Tepidimonas taiwanensis]